MDPVAEPLWLYGERSEHEALAWSWVDAQLEAAGTYWVVADGTGQPHPRPVWGVWMGQRLHLSVGSPRLGRQLGVGALVTVHLDSGTDVVILEGRVAGTSIDRPLLERYDAKYDWTYDVDELGPLAVVAPALVKAWRSSGWAGRDGFAATGRFRFG